MIIKSENGHIYIIKRGIIKQVLYNNKTSPVLCGTIGCKIITSYKELTEIEMDTFLLEQL